MLNLILSRASSPVYDGSTPGQIDPSRELVILMLGKITAFNKSGPNLHLIVDVNGYFE